MNDPVDFFDGTDHAGREIRYSVQRALRKAAITMGLNVFTRAPVDTGRLKGSITHSVGNGEAEVFTNVEYAPRVEYGFKGQDSLGRAINQKPQPFFRNGAKASEGPIGEIFTKELGRPIKVALGGKK